MAGKTLAAAGMSERPARNWRTGTQLAERGVAVDGGRRCGRGRTREDPFADLGQSEVVPQLVTDTDGRLQVRTLFTALCRRQPGRFPAGAAYGGCSGGVRERGGWQ